MLLFVLILIYDKNESNKIAVIDSFKVAYPIL